MTEHILGLVLSNYGVKKGKIVDSQTNVHVSFSVF